MLGQDQTKVGDRLVSFSEDDLFQSLKYPSEELGEQIMLLRTGRNLSARTSAAIEQKLPYMVCALFNPMCHREEYFAAAEHFCIDIKIPVGQSHEEYLAWRQEVHRLPRLIMAFLSARGDRLHLIYKLRERCRDRGKFRLFYREFTCEVCQKLHIDYDPTAAEADPGKCIPLSIDPEVYYCIGASLVRFEDYVTARRLDDLHAQLQERKRASRRKPSPPKAEQPEEVNDETLDKIKSILGRHPRTIARTVNERLKQLDAQAEQLKSYLSEQQYSLGDILLLKAGRKVFVEANGEPVILNILFADEDHVSVACATGSTKNRDLCNAVRQTVLRYLKQNKL